MGTESRAAISTPLASLARDVCFAVRSFRLNPLFTAAVLERAIEAIQPAKR